MIILPVCLYKAQKLGHYSLNKITIMGIVRHSPTENSRVFKLIMNSLIIFKHLVSLI